MKSLNELSREELYDLVWTEAMALLAPKLGLSDVGLKKKCQSLGIPTPGRGYWARLAAGKGVKREPLPSSWSIQRKSKSLPKSVEAVRHFTSKCNYGDDDLAKPALKALHRLRKAKPSSDGLVGLAGAGLLSINVAPDNLGRAAWLWSRLIEQLPRHGLTLQLARTCSVTDGTATITLELRELLARYERPYNPTTDSRLFWGDPPATVKLLTPTGFLAFRSESIQGAGCSHEWRDASSTPLDHRIILIAEGLALLAKRKSEIEEQHKVAKLKREEDDRLRAIEAESQRREQARREKLKEAAMEFATAEAIRRLASRLKALEPEAEGIQSVISWANDVANEIDPCGTIIGEVGQGKDPFRSYYGYGWLNR